MSEDRVTEALNALRGADLDIETGPGAEVRALLAFRRQQRRIRFRRMALSLATSAAAAAAVLWLTVPRVQTRITTAPEVAVNEPPPIPPQSQPAVIHKSAAPRRSPAPQAPEEIATDFYPLMVSAPPLERAMLVRVTVRAAAMRSVGLNVGDEHLADLVQADVLVGQDNLARAIRFVSYRNREE